LTELAGVSNHARCVKKGGEMMAKSAAKTSKAKPKTKAKTTKTKAKAKKK